MKKLLLLVAVIWIVSISVAAEKKQDKQIKPVTPEKPAQDGYTNASQIVVILMSLSLESSGPMKPDRTFRPNESVFVNLDVQGLTPNKQKKYVIQADISIPQFDQEKKNILDSTIDADKNVSIFIKISIPEVDRGGPCDVMITIRDVVARKYVDYHTWFMIAK
ncbi:MAG: hypothetical protein A2176_05695 [Spirochaetes bacterium RBG_13_51_14]|nr:MAG: hypothetical protein A2176_05695 [Spirochaetes bacterium RBG_13_51_14]